MTPSLRGQKSDLGSRGPTREVLVERSAHDRSHYRWHGMADLDRLRGLGAPSEFPATDLASVADTLRASGYALRPVRMLWEDMRVEVQGRYFVITWPGETRPATMNRFGICFWPDTPGEILPGWNTVNFVHDLKLEEQIRSAVTAAGYRSTAQGEERVWSFQRTETAAESTAAVPA